MKLTQELLLTKDLDGRLTLWAAEEEPYIVEERDCWDADFLHDDAEELDEKHLGPMTGLLMPYIQLMKGRDWRESPLAITVTAEPTKE